MPKAAPDQILDAADRELILVLKRLIRLRTILYAKYGWYPEELSFALEKMEFVVHQLLAGLVSPALPAPKPDPAAKDAKAESAAKPDRVN